MINIFIENYINRQFIEVDNDTKNLDITLIRYIFRNTQTVFEFHFDEMENEISDLFFSIINLQKYRFRERQNKTTYKQFLASEDIDDGRELFKWVHNIENKIINNRIRLAFETGSFSDFYNSFCHAQARLLDLFDDYNFLLDTLELMITENSKNKGIIFPNIADILNQVIIQKSIPHSLAKEKLAKVLFETKYMIDFKNELQKISKEWGLIK